MSYILDALRRAAERREREAPAVRRLFVRAPTAAPPSAGSRPRVIAAVVVNVLVLAALAVAVLHPARVAPPPAPAASAPPVVASRAAPASPPHDAAVVAAPPPAPPVAAPAPPPPAVASSAPRTRAPETPRPARRASAVRPAPATTPAPAVAATTPPSDATGLELQALVYADAPAGRMVFIDGRKYVEGDVVEGRWRVEEIQEKGVVLSANGRRITLRPSVR